MNITEEFNNLESVGATGSLIDLFNKELSQDEWNALCIVHKLTNRLNIGIRFDYTRSIDVKSKTGSQIIDDTVFLQKFKK